MDYQPPSYCYETPPQEPRYQPLENSKPILTIVEPRATCWEPVISTQVIPPIKLIAHLRHICRIAEA